ncbi:MAG: hypothetical protein ACPIOQ_83700 [Promethearchaeia archaeon]
MYENCSCAVYVATAASPPAKILTESMETTDVLVWTTSSMDIMPFIISLVWHNTQVRAKTRVRALRVCAAAGPDARHAVEADRPGGCPTDG